MTATISACGLRKVFRSGWRRRHLVAVESLDLEVKPGEAFGFLGPNGAGKTTSVMMLLGNVLPTAGTGRLCGYPLGHPAGRRRVGFLPEKFRFHDFLTAAELLDVHGRLHGVSRDGRRARIPDLLEQVGLAGRADTPLREFSKGMQQRLGLAQALVHDPDVLILDEPTSALDPLGRKQVRDLIMDLKSRGKTVFLNSHLLSEIELCCDRIAIMHRGRVLRQGGIAELTAPSLHVELRVAGATPTLRERLEALSCQVQVEGDRVSVSLKRHDRLGELAPAVLESGATLLELRPQRENLEQLFVRVVEDPRSEGEDAAR